MLVLLMRCPVYWYLARRQEYVISRLSARTLIPLLHLLDKPLGFLLIDKREAGVAVLEFKRMEEDSILSVVKILVQLLIPDNPPLRRRDVYHLQPECVTDEVVHQGNGAREAGVGP